MTKAQLKKLAKLVAKDLVENAFDIPAENARDFIEDLAREWRANPVAKLADELLKKDEGDDEFWDLREEIDVLIERARKAAFAALKTPPKVNSTSAECARSC